MYSFLKIFLAKSAQDLFIEYAFLIFDGMLPGISVGRAASGSQDILKFFLQTPPLAVLWMNGNGNSLLVDF